MNNHYRIFWGDSHHQSYIPVQDPTLDEVLAQTSRYLDFYCGAYYMKEFTFAPVLAAPSIARRTVYGHLHDEPVGDAPVYRGVHLEGSKSESVLIRQWADMQQATALANQPGAFVTFPGYEWQGNGRWGDHNVIYRSEGFNLCDAETLPELYAYLRELKVGALAIPHHTAYLTGQRAPNWANLYEILSPYAEIFSVHGCSETDEEWIGLRRNPHMGPGAGGSTYQAALDEGLHLGAICSTDNWTQTPGHWGQGLMACLAKELTRDSLWDAFRKRRVYGVTGDRIALDFTCNDAVMGSILPAAPERRLEVSVRGADAIDRIELLRNGRVIATYTHQGAWSMPEANARTRWKLRVEIGWGPRSSELPAPDTRWQGALTIAGGRMLDWQPCWVTLGQPVPRLEHDTATFEIVHGQNAADRDERNAIVFEFEADTDAALHLQANGLDLRDTVQGVSQCSRVLWDKESCEDLLLQVAGVTREQAEATDAYYHFANKIKVHRAMPEAAYTAALSFVDDEPLSGETHYRVRVEQRNGQRAWSSPIWVQA